MDRRFKRLPEGTCLRTGLQPGDLGRLIELHGRVYQQFPGFGLAFEAFVAQTVAEFGLQRRFAGKVWLIEGPERLLGCCALAESTPRLGQLRWVVIDPSLRGRGLGQWLVEQALDYARAKQYERVFLETTDGLAASSSLYRKLGFVQSGSTEHELWDGRRTLITMQLKLTKKKPESANALRP